MRDADHTFQKKGFNFDRLFINIIYFFSNFRKFWKYLLEEVSKVVQSYIAQDVSDLKQLKSAVKKRDAAQAELDGKRIYLII